MRRAAPTAAAGFTLIETLVALGIFTIGLVGVSGMLVQSARGNAANEARTQAGILAESILEEVEALAADPANFAADGTFLMPGGQITRWSDEVSATLPRGALYVTAGDYLVAGAFSNQLVVDVGWGQDADSGAATSHRTHRYHAIKRFTAR
jgi:prepilin-type N-terminal cleavage/methylation domain-containing protein